MLDVACGDPVDFAHAFGWRISDPIRCNESDGAGAVLTDRGDERESAPRRDLEAPGPALEDELVVGQKVPKERLDDVVSVFCPRQRHR